jgi:succinyl-diaminopimelate desuccinylase
MGNGEADISTLTGLTELQRRVLEQIDDEAVIAFHRGLVQIPSVNPPGDVREAIAYCEGPLREAGFVTEIVSIDETMPSLIAWIGGGDGPTLAFNAHVDVVPIGERSAWTHDPFGAEIENGRIYGRGAGDDKASVAAQVMAGIAVARSGVELKGTLIVNEVADEESGGYHGARYVCEADLITPDYVIVGEQTLNEVALGEKGSSPTIVRVHGRTAHGALPWEGANAIEAMAEIIVALRREYWPIIAQRTNPYFHPSSSSVNMVSGGVKANVVPDYAEMTIDRRIVPGEDPDGVRQELREIAERAVAGIEGIRIEVIESYEGRAASLQDESSDLVTAMLAANEVLGLSSNLRGFSMATDGRFFAAKGIPTIIYGPGDPSLAHIPDEWIGVDELLQATRAYALAAVAFLA